MTTKGIARFGEASVPNGISVFEAVESELGLKLVKQKRSIPVIVVDHVNEKPIGDQQPCTRSTPYPFEWTVGRSEAI